MSEPVVRKVLMAEELAIALGADRVDWGEPDEDGFYTPTLYKTYVVDSEAAQQERERIATAVEALPFEDFGDFTRRVDDAWLDRTAVLAVIRETPLALNGPGMDEPVKP